MKSCKLEKTTRGCMDHFFGKAKTLADLVREYQNLQKPKSLENCNPIRSMMEGYRELPDLDDAIFSASYAHDLVGKRYVNGSERAKPKRHGHQYRISKAPMNKAHKELQAKITALESADSFETVYECVSKICEPIKGLGVLYIYDAALRIGAFLKLKPKRVYLHAGALTGAKNLGLDVKNASLAVKDFPKPVQILQPYEIEDFLCVCKEHIKKVKI